MFSAPMISFFMISIHAPARGATTIPKIQLLTERHFNPRSREGSDQTGMTTIVAVTNFNPRSREGSDGRINEVDN